jgi:hypothetical protein
MRMRSALVALAILLCHTTASAQNKESQSPPSLPKVVLRILPESTTIRAGERLKLRVELWNLGPNDLIVAQDLDATFGNSQLLLFLQKGSTQEAGA